MTWFFGYKSGQVTSCLRDVKAQVSKPCKAQLAKIMMDVGARPRLHGVGAGRWAGVRAVWGLLAGAGLQALQGTSEIMMDVIRCDISGPALLEGSSSTNKACRLAWSIMFHHWS